MRRTFSLCFQCSLKHLEAAITPPPIIQLEDATFYRHHPTSTVEHDRANPPIFPRTTFVLPSSASAQQYWAVTGPSNAGKTTFLEVLRGQHVCIPPTARSYPYLSDRNTVLRNHASRSPSAAIHYVGFGDQGGVLGSPGIKGAYMSARYESRKEATDFSVMDYLKGNTELNPHEKVNTDEVALQDLTQVIQELKLDNLIDMPVGNLSNGQTRRARIAKALLGKPEVLLLDEPFMGLDPSTRASLSLLLFKLAQARSPRLVLALRPQDLFPDWITDILYLNPKVQIAAQGKKESVLPKIGERALASSTVANAFRSHTTFSEPAELGEPVVQMKNVVVKYGDREILGGWNTDSDTGTRAGLDWTVRKGERWGVFGPNGSGKTTLISLICSDHPQAYCLQIQMFGRGRLPQLGQPGISIFDIQARIGHSSPEVHAFFPRSLTIRQTIENAWAETFLGTPRLTYERNEIVDTVLYWFEEELNPNFKPRDSGKVKDYLSEAQDHRSPEWADTLHFRDVSVSSQRVLLFLRAVVKKPELVVLDEAFGGMDARVRDKCMIFLTEGTRCVITSRVLLKGARVQQTRKAKTLDEMFGAKISGLTEDQALICVSHVKEEVPDIVREWMCLPEAGENKPVRFGRLNKALRIDEAGWHDVWGLAFNIKNKKRVKKSESKNEKKKKR